MCRNLAYRATVLASGLSHLKLLGKMNYEN